MGIKCVLLVNKQGQTRLAKYSDSTLSTEERRSFEAEVVRKCITRVERECNFIEYRDMKVVYRRYASLFFLVGVDGDENELAILEFIHCMVETLDKWFSNVCELDILFSLETAHFIIDEMCMNGTIVETNRQNALAPIHLLEKAMT
ncbi:small chain of the clathrin adaptor complex [Helicosporidium sp. ATCC 50920]|nr:small chain of the clathrin adaptor complex [Helicosporidium sp. ATCC 50920]|eukprot:KDD74689.1 small chain of the clathrin adaptor complex [Helicosporidium sp. ATCC 50920]